MHPLFLFSLATLACGATTLALLWTNPLYLRSDRLVWKALVRCTLPAVGFLDHLLRRSGALKATSRIFQRIELARSSFRDAASSHGKTDVFSEPAWFWSKTRRVFVKASLNLLRRHVATPSFRLWKPNGSVCKGAGRLSTLTTMVFAVGSSSTRYPKAKLIPE